MLVAGQELGDLATELENLAIGLQLGGLGLLLILSEPPRPLLELAARAGELIFEMGGALLGGAQPLFDELSLTLLQSVLQSALFELGPQALKTILTGAQLLAQIGQLILVGVQLLVSFDELIAEIVDATLALVVAQLQLGHPGQGRA